MAAIVLGLSVVAGLAMWLLVARWTDRSDCKVAARQRPPGDAVVVCRDAYETSREPSTGIRLADLLRQSGDPLSAKALANQFLETTMRADALQILGKIAVSEDRLDDAANALQQARQLHRVQLQPVNVARDDLALAEVHSRRYMFAEALLSLDECLESTAADATIKFHCQIATARVLMAVGMFDMAAQELSRADAGSDGERLRLEAERGNIEQEIGREPGRKEHTAQAISRFEQVLALNERAQLPGMNLAANLELAYSLAESGRLDEAARRLEIAQTLDLDNKRGSQRTQLAARVAFRRGDLELAWSLNETAYATSKDLDERLDVAVIQTRIALVRGDLVRAEEWARRGIEDVEGIRRMQSAMELRPWVLSTRREPYELLFVVLARAGRTLDALLALDRWSGRTMIDAMARPSVAVSLDLRSVATRVRNLDRWLPSTSSALEGEPAGREAVLDALQATDLLALVVANDRLWCVTSNRGALALTDLGPFAAVTDRIDDFKAHPAGGAQLGELLLRDGVFRRTSTPLHVLLDDRLGAVPVVALRREGLPLIAVRPVIRIPKLLDRSCSPADSRTGVTVIGDARGDLPDARREAHEVAALVGASAIVGTAATADALFAHSGAALLHVSVHGDYDTGGGVLRMYDRSVWAPEIAARKLRAALVVLLGCNSAAAKDHELAGSLAMAFLAAGSSRVIATLRPVSDAGTRELSLRFYRAGGVADPVRALARVQAELAGTENADWPNVAVFGHDICSERRR